MTTINPERYPNSGTDCCGVKTVATLEFDTPLDIWNKVSGLESPWYLAIMS